MNQEDWMQQIETKFQEFKTNMDRRISTIETKLSEVIQREKTNSSARVNISSSVERSPEEIIPKVDALLSTRKDEDPAKLTATYPRSLSDSPSNTPSVSLTSTPSDKMNIFNATKIGDLKIVKELLKTGVSVNQRNSDGYTPLHIAASAGHEHVLNVLRNAGAKVDVVGPLYRTPLHWSADGGHVDATRQLVTAGAQVDAKDKGDATPLMLATKSSHCDLASYLLSVGASPLMYDKNGDNPLIVAIEKNRLDIVKTMIEKCKSRVKESGIGKYEKTPLSVACRKGDVEIVMELLNNNITVGSNDVEKALSYAGNAGVLFVFEDAKPGILSEKGIWACEEALEAGRRKVVDAFIATGVKVKDSSHNPALITAAKNGDSNFISLLLEMGVDTNHKDESDWNALHWACERGHLQCIRVLLDGGLDINSCTDYKRTPLMLCAMNGYSECVSFLLERRANKSLKDEKGENALKIAKNYVRRECVRLLQ